MIKITQKGKFEKATKYFVKLSKFDFINNYKFEKYGERGVNALMEATPVDSGKTRDSWYYEIVKEDDRAAIRFCNSNINKHVNIAIILQYGHATRNGGWVEGIDYINPALQPVFEKIADEAWKEITQNG